MLMMLKGIAPVAIDSNTLDDTRNDMIPMVHVQKYIDCVFAL